MVGSGAKPGADDLDAWDCGSGLVPETSPWMALDIKASVGFWASAAGGVGVTIVGAGALTIGEAAGGGVWTVAGASGADSEDVGVDTPASATGVASGWFTNFSI